MNSLLINQWDSDTIALTHRTWHYGFYKDRLNLEISVPFLNKLSLLLFDSTVWGSQLFEYFLEYIFISEEVKH